MFFSWLFFFALVRGDTSDGVLLRKAQESIAALERELVRVKADLAACREAHSRNNVIGDHQHQEAHETERRTQDIMWYVSSGDCVLDDGCLSSPKYPDEYELGSTCEITITPAWRGYLWVEWLELRSTNCWTSDGVFAECEDALYIDDVRHDSAGGTSHQASSVHGSVPTRSIVWSAGDATAYSNSHQPIGWKICQEEAPLPPWILTTVWNLPCLMDRAGCLSFGHMLPHEILVVGIPSSCRASLSDDWEGTFRVEYDQFDWGEEPNSFEATVSGTTFSGASLGDAARRGLEGLEARGTLTVLWKETRWEDKICPGPPVNLSGPWGDVPWTCNIAGDPCIGACTQQFSDPDDADGDGDLHDGHPRCNSSAGDAYCGPCKCGLGEAQNYTTMSLYDHTPPFNFIRCTPCSPGTYKSDSKDETTDECHVCNPGSSSTEGATACTSCDPGTVSNEVTHLCVPCQAGFFGGAAEQTACQECGDGQYTIKEGLTACEVCSVGSISSGKNVGCEQCSPGSVGIDTLSSACVPCEAGSFQTSPGMSQCLLCNETLDPSGENLHLWTTMEADLQGAAWKEISGASSVQRCGCAPSAWADHLGTCRPCGEGVQCSGMGNVVVLPGYFANVNSAGFVWRCYGADWRRCPGGVAGTCAEGRNNESIACGECKAFTRMTNDGPCEVCEGPDVVLLIGAIVLMLIALGCVYLILAHENMANRKDVMTLAAIVGSQFLTTFQMVGALNSLSILWPQPFAAMVELGSLMNSRLEVLNLSCVVSTSPLYRYLGTLFSFGLLIACVVVYHLLHVLVFRRGLFRQSTPILLCAVGTIFLTVFISVSASIFEPFHCDKHPNGEATMKAYRQVVCWNTDYGDEHQRMVVMGLIASLIPVGFFSVCVWATIALPRKLDESDVVFLKTFSFLFFRFRPGAHAFVLVLLFRNLAFALLPAITPEVIDVFALTVAVLLCLMACCLVFPWAVYQANHLDVSVNLGLLLILLLAAFQTESASGKLVGNMLVAVFFAFMSCFAAAGTWCLHLLRLRFRRPFQFFLCHHKEGAGAFCRLLKVRLLRHRLVKRDVFLDSDNLRDLSLLFGIVREKTDTLVVLCSRDILQRPWCVGEMTTARLHRLDTILILFRDFNWPSSAFLAGYTAHVQGILSLAAYGVSVEMVQETLRWLPGRPHIALPPALSLPCVNAVVEEVTRRRQGRDEMASERLDQRFENVCVSHRVTTPLKETSSIGVRVVSIVDHHVQESVCAALLLKELLKDHFPLSDAGHVLEPHESIPETANTLLVVCSSGCFQRPSIVRQLFEAEEHGIGAVPIIVDDRFQFPGESMYAELRTMSTHIMTGTARHVDEFVALIGCLFQEIGISFRCQDSQGVLEVRATAVAQRLASSCKPLTATSPSAPQDEAASEETEDVDLSDETEGSSIRICL